jgi:hypothetical protein
VLVFVALDGRRGIERAQAVQAGAAKDAADRGPAQLSARGRCAGRRSAAGEKPKPILLRWKRFGVVSGAAANCGTRSRPAHTAATAHDAVRAAIPVLTRPDSARWKIARWPAELNSANVPLCPVVSSFPACRSNSSAMLYGPWPCNEGPSAPVAPRSVEHQFHSRNTAVHYARSSRSELLVSNVQGSCASLSGTFAISSNSIVISGNLTFGR